MATNLNPTVSRDNYVISTAGANTYNGTNFFVGGTSHAYIGFDLSAIPTGAPVLSAVLTLTRDRAAQTQTITFTNVTDTWIETSLTWNNRPADGTVTATGTMSASSSTNVATAFDITNVMQALVNNGQNGIHLSAPSGSNGFYSRSALTSGYRPTLAVTYLDANERAVTVDAMVLQGAPTNNYGTSAALGVGQFGGTTGQRQTFIELDLSDIPANADVTTANLYLTISGTSGTVPMGFAVERNTASWTETGITWNTKPTTASVVGQDVVSYPNSIPAVNTLLTINIAPVIEAILASGTNHGIALINTNTSTDNLLTLHSSESTTGAARPYFSVEYTAVVNTDATVNVAPMEMSGAGVMPGITAVHNPDATPDAEFSTLVAEIVQPTVSVVSNIDIAANPMGVEILHPSASGMGQTNVTVLAGAPAEGSASFPGGYRHTAFTTIPITKDTWINQNSTGSNYGQSPTLTVQNTAWAFFDFSTNLGRENVHKATLTFTPIHNTGVIGGNNLYYRLYAITGYWTEDDLTYNTAPPMIHVQDIEGVLQQFSPVTVDVTAALAQGAYGFAVQNINTQQHQYSSEEGTYPPTLNITYEVAPIPVTVTAPVFTTNLVAPEATVLIRKDVENSVAPATATSLSLDPVVGTTTVPDVTIYAGTLDAALEFEGKYSVSAVMAAEVTTAEGEIKVPEIYTEQNAVISASAVTARARIIPVAEEQPVDTWSERLNAQTDANDIWLRLNETAGTVAVAAKGTNGTYRGGPTLGQFGLENRRYVDFDGYDDYIEFPYRENLSQNGAVEMVFRTTDADGTLMYGMGDAIYNENMGGYFGLGYQIITNITLNTGKIRVNMMQFGGSGIPYFEGSKRVDDGQWHHIVVVWVNTQMRVYLDGKLHFQRHLLDSRSTIVGAPMAIGRDFDGDIMEFVFRGENYLGQHDIQQNYYAAFGIIPNFATPMGAIAAAGEGNKGKGNQKRALALYYYADHYSNMEPPLAFKDDKYNWVGMRMHPTFNGFIKSKDDEPFLFGPYLTFPKSVQKGTGEEYMSGQYYDAVTGELRYIDFMEDIDMSEYDLVFFVNTPPRHNYASGYGDEPAYLSNLYDNMFLSLRQAQDTYGFSLWIPQPQIAADYGIISTVEEHSMMRESMNTNDQGNAAGLYDRRSWEVDPAGLVTLAGTGELENGDMGRYYFDTHAINKARVTAYLPEFNDWGGYIIEDYFFSLPRDPWTPPFEGWKFKDINDRGLRIGDEVYYPNQDYFNNAGTASGFFDRHKRRTVVSVPPTAVKAGTVILREQMSYWHGRKGELKEIPNPWRDNAVTIAVQPGDNVGGRPIGGKVLVDFMNNLDSWQLFRKQLVPADVPESLETEAMQAWDYLTLRTSRVSTVVSDGTTKRLPGGSVSSGGWEWDNTVSGGSMMRAINRNSVLGSGAVMSVNEFERYDVVELPNVNLFDRGILWLSVRQEYVPGQIVNRPNPHKVEAGMPMPIVGGEIEVVIKAEPMVARLQQITPDGVADPDVTIAPFPLRASARITQYTKYIRPAPFTAEAEVKEPDRFYVATPESVTLWLYHTDPTLYIMEVK